MALDTACSESRTDELSPSQSVTWTTAKRFSEFEALQKKMLATHKGTWPKLPPKKLFGSLDEDFVQKRQKDLQAYLNECLKIEPDCATEALEAFLEIPFNRTVAYTERKSDLEEMRTSLGEPKEMQLDAEERLQARPSGGGAGEGV